MSSEGSLRPSSQLLRRWVPTEPALILWDPGRKLCALSGKVGCREGKSRAMWDTQAASPWMSADPGYSCSVSCAPLGLSFPICYVGPSGDLF